MTNKRGTVKFFTFSFEIDAPNIISCAPKIFSCAPKNLHLVAQVLQNSNLNFEPWIKASFEEFKGKDTFFVREWLRQKA